MSMPSNEELGNITGFYYFSVDNGKVILPFNFRGERCHVLYCHSEYGDIASLFDFTDKLTNIGAKLWKIPVYNTGFIHYYGVKW